MINLSAEHDTTRCTIPDCEICPKINMEIVVRNFETGVGNIVQAFDTLKYALDAANKKLDAPKHTRTHDVIDRIRRSKWNKYDNHFEVPIGKSRVWAAWKAKKVRNILLDAYDEAKEGWDSIYAEYLTLNEYTTQLKARLQAERCGCGSTECDVCGDEDWYEKE